MYSQMTKLTRIVVTWKTTVCLDMRRSSDGSWQTLVKRSLPNAQQPRAKSAAWKRLVRNHHRGIRR